ncbi:alkyl/aryl-sulfatase [Nocardiopsis metallicus]|uniref:Alkyl sulfatase BDS1-like metallo-beta-lactamase superfamily hydrolase n=1 Tax=Nocardiopsis metallicus TaxID=179819 RepID=A0A840WKP8_9ACTN|nr:alkyl sulfatase dimerization domain-containing protein [Nocardiopsis metallicus]MBB5492425.1 alkyl sulfatase BDS1-like metallo-beta-lactamase superfamily hydrolase [Nocardiopsis metallicus]
MTGNGPDHSDDTDFVNADRGLIARLEPGRVRDDNGRVVWDADAYGFLEGECPDTADPGLWRQSQLCARQGLFEVTEGIYQIRGLDLSNMTLVEGDQGVLVIDPLVSAEPARAGLELYRAHRGDRPVSGVIYSQSHVDHFGGVGGVTDGTVPILAPAGFMEHAVSENVYTGPAMARRGLFHTGSHLEAGPRGHIGVGLGLSRSSGTVTLIAPNRSITRTGQEEVVDGVRIVFQMTPGPEASTEMNFYFPEHRALCMAENATHNLHDILTLRGAPVRDARVWSRYLDEAIALFAHESEVLFASHHWPTWGADEIVAFLRQQRDLYAYLHDQTLRLINQGYVGMEIAEHLRIPPGLEREWHTRGYHGSVSHNVKAIYQRYMGWFDGNPAHLWEHPPEEAARRYVECMGGIDEVVRKADGYRDRGDLRFAATLLNHAVFTDPGHARARAALAGVYERLGFGSESATWRNFYLQGAAELRRGKPDLPPNLGTGMGAALSVDQLFESVAIRVNGPKAWEEYFVIDWVFTDLDTTYRTTLSNGALTTREKPRWGEPDLTITLNKFRLLRLLAGKGTEGMSFSGDEQLLDRLLGLLDQPDPTFDIVTP